MTGAEAQGLIDAVAAWVRGRPDLMALGLAGSWARSAARPESDIDLLVLCDNPAALRTEKSWLPQALGPNRTIVSHADEDYGVVWSCRIFLRPDAELELAFGPLDWTSLDPVDPGTRQVVSDGFKVIVDKDGRMQRLVDAVTS